MSGTGTDEASLTFMWGEDAVRVDELEKAGIKGPLRRHAPGAADLAAVMGGVEHQPADAATLCRRHDPDPRWVGLVELETHSALPEARPEGSS